MQDVGNLSFSLRYMEVGKDGKPRSHKLSLVSEEMVKSSSAIYIPVPNGNNSLPFYAENIPKPPKIERL